MWSAREEGGGKGRAGEGDGKDSSPSKQADHPILRIHGETNMKTREQSHPPLLPMPPLSCMPRR